MATKSGIKPRASFWHIWNMCFGFLGLQFGLGLQNANVSRIFQTLGAGLDQIPALWIAAPLTGLLVQPLVGYLSDRTWSGMGRRRPYLLAGALLSAAALLIMPMSPWLWLAAVMLWILDASINTSMQPFRALVGDQLPPEQRTAGYAVQSFFIGMGAVVASMLPWLFQQAGVSNVAVPGEVPDTVRYAFFCGAAMLFLSVLWTVLSTHEYPPAALEAFEDMAPPLPVAPAKSGRMRTQGFVWSAAGAAGIYGVFHFALDQQLYLICAGALIWGLALLWQSSAKRKGLFADIMRNIETMPEAMRRLAPVQFFSWLALFAMWIYTTSAVTSVYFGSSDPASAAYNAGANWVGVLFAAYNGFAALAAIVIPFVVRRIGMRWAHLVNVWLGAAGFLSFVVIRDPHWLLVSMLGVGAAWASILSLPYALLSDSVPAAQMGVYMGIFNFFIVIPQLVAASVLGFFLKTLFGGAPIYALGLGGVCFLLSGLLVLRLPKEAEAPRG
ncbi:MAG: MFS transporter [Pseudomonadota bacterium]|nr:MFS transporter [Pseudomonadota bacterium]